MLTKITELAAKHGQAFKVPKRGMRVGSDPLLSAAHRAAAVLHGWNKFERLTGELPQLEDDVYLAALEAAKTGDKHAPAITTVEAEAPEVEAPVAAPIEAPAAEETTTETIEG